MLPRAKFTTKSKTSLNKEAGLFADTQSSVESFDCDLTIFTRLNIVPITYSALRPDHCPEASCLRSGLFLHHA